MDVLNSASTFWRTCDPNGQNCHCDWRLSLYSCAETIPIGIIFKIQVIWAALVSVLAALLLLHRLRQGQRLFDTRRGYMRPQPVESMVVFAFIFNTLRMIHSIIILKGYDENYIFRSFLFEIPWQFGFGAFAAYLWGIGTTVFDSETVIEGGWRLSPAAISKIGFSFLFTPMLTNNICSIASGAFAQQGDAYKADIFARLLYAFWTFYCTALAVCVIYSGVRLMKLLGQHLEMIGSGKRYDQVKHGRMKVCWIMSVTGLCLICFAVILCSYAIWRPQIMSNTAANITWSVLWNFAGPTATLLIEVALFIDPRMFGGPTFSASGSSAERNTEAGFGSSFTATDQNKSAIPLSWIKEQDDTKRSSAQSSRIYNNSAISDSTLLIHQAPYSQATVFSATPFKDRIRLVPV
ncbi:hypothetical protein INT43_005485 [Umbelopsis isabellina]|uniref:Uncharacterized protein n=1 Tax=Mortierella isabellina TaxID=91625 RepID=A0A8H7PN64_MORIS|nr:hypothetical protein INT43_005485 [Umbelopsis isabellina]